MNPILEQLRNFDTPTIANALEIAGGKRSTEGFTKRTLIAANAKLKPIVGYARTAMIRSATPFNPQTRRETLLDYYQHVAGAGQPTIAVIQDIDNQPGLGAFWGEVNTTVHWGLGCVGAITNGSMRDLEMMEPRFQCLAASLSPSHAWVHVVEIGVKVDVCGLMVSPDDIVHADHHGAVVIPLDLLEKMPTAIDLMARKEKLILDAAKASGFSLDKLRAAMTASDAIK